MSRKQTLLLLIVAIMGCNEESSKDDYYTSSFRAFDYDEIVNSNSKVLHNSYCGHYAVFIDSAISYSYGLYSTMGDRPKPHARYLGDEMKLVNLGSERKFNDSLSAVKALIDYQNMIKEQDMIARKKKVADSIAKAKKHIQDSITALCHKYE